MRGMAIPTPLRQVVRRLGRAPLFTALTVATLALALGANTAIFSVLNGVLLEPLPYPEPDRLVGVWHVAPGVNLPELGSAAFLYFTYREEGRTFQDVGLWSDRSATVTGLRSSLRRTSPVQRSRCTARVTAHASRTAAMADSKALVVMGLQSCGRGAHYMHADGGMGTHVAVQYNAC